MESSEDVEVLSRAIEKLLHEKRKREASGDPFIEDHDDQLLLSNLISQLESPNPGGKTDGTIIEEQVEEKKDQEEDESPPSKGKREESLEEIAKDIKEVKKQNKVTHILLSVLIILTLTWQVSEYSMISMMKDRISHPIRSVSGMLSGMFKNKIPPIQNKTSNSKDQNNNGGVQIQVPEMLHDIGFNNDDD